MGEESGPLWKLLATHLGRLLGWYEEGQAAGFIMPVVGAIVLLLIYRLIRKKAG